MRYFGADILTLLKKIATDDLNNMIDTIKTERGDSGLESVRRIAAGKFDKQYPECTISLQDSENQEEEITIEIGNTAEVFPAEIMIIFKDNTDKIMLRTEYFIEALSRIYHGYTDQYVSWIVVKGGIRADVYTDTNEILKAAGVRLEIRVL